eukprot:m.195477 g.195477  ORF g.195477 m.195477 type:complete len:208 (-) comp13667_c2_seq5:701-1324(-)
MFACARCCSLLSDAPCISMYVASLSNKIPPTSDMGAYTILSFSSKRLFPFLFFSSSFDFGLDTGPSRAQCCRCESLRLRHVHLLTLLQDCSTNISVQRHLSIAFLVQADVFWISHILKSVDEQIRVRVAPHQRPELHDGDEAREVVDVPLRIHSIDDGGEVEELRTLRDLRLETILQLLLPLPQLLGGLHLVEVCQNTHNTRHTVDQ